MLPESPQRQALLVSQLMGDILSASHVDDIVALRGSYRWLQVFEDLPFAEGSQQRQRMRQDGVYLITGGLGGIALARTRSSGTTPDTG